jgi:hypothetical protein
MGRSEVQMRIGALLLFASSLAGSVVPVEAKAQKAAKTPRILSAEFVYFDDRTAVDAVHRKALKELKKWGRFQIVTKQQKADLIFLLSADPYKGGYIIFSGGQTGTIDPHGEIDVDPVPNHNKLAPVRYAYLAVIDAKNGDTLWSDSCRWGGLLTGFDSVGARLIRKLEKQTK